MNIYFNFLINYYLGWGHTVTIIVIDMGTAIVGTFTESFES